MFGRYDGMVTEKPRESQRQLDRAWKRAERAADGVRTTLRAFEAAALGVLLLTLCFTKWRPVSQVREHQEAFFRAVEDRKARRIDGTDRTQLCRSVGIRSNPGDPGVRRFPEMLSIGWFGAGGSTDRVARGLRELYRLCAGAGQPNRSWR